MTAVHPLLAYGWYWGWWWWWWIVILFFLWWLLLPPFSYGRRWYGGYRSRGAGVGAAYVGDWQAIESHFIESPAAGVAEADRVVGDLMARVRPSTGLAEEYRDAHAIAVKAQSGTATPDEMRAAMLKFRALFDRLAPTV